MSNMVYIQAYYKYQSSKVSVFNVKRGGEERERNISEWIFHLLLVRHNFLLKRYF